MSFATSVHVTVRIEQLGSQWTDFHYIWYLRIVYYALWVIKAAYLKHYFLNHSCKHLRKSLFLHRCSMILSGAGSSARLLQTPAWLSEATKIWQYVHVHWIHSSLNCICLWDGNMGMWSLLLPVTACRQAKLLWHMRVILKVNRDTMYK